MSTRSKQRLLTQARLKELVHYDPETGVMTWKVSRSRAIKGSVVGWLHRGRYARTQIDGQLYAVHRLAYLYMTGSWPTEIDHINGTGYDNRWSNLRVASRSENQKNRARHINNTSGVCGVYFFRGKWSAEIKSNGKRIYLGRFDIKSEAVQARKDAEKLHGFTERHGT